MTKPEWTIYHPNGLYTGSALRMLLEKDNISAEIAPQKSIIGAPYPMFDWEKSVRIRLDIIELAEILEVLRGYKESVEDGKGFFHRTKNGCVAIRFVHMVEPVEGYKLDIIHNPLRSSEDVAHLSFSLRTIEAFALSEVLSHAMCYIAFGCPDTNE